jgi:two-component system, chemotaxis family, protein-glutamate methylesterase/glutaminase
LPIDKSLISRWQNSEILLLGGSAGSFNIIFRVIRNMKSDFGKAVIVVIHRRKNFFSEIEKLFAENSRMLFKEITDKERIRPHTVYVAPANYHTLIEKERCFGLDVSESVWYSKPSIDVTFESAAEVYKDRCTAILFSGANQDGAEGLLKLRNKGAITIAQSPEDAEMPQMPEAAININAAEYILHTSEILELIETK